MQFLGVASQLAALNKSHHDTVAHPQRRGESSPRHPTLRRDRRDANLELLVGHLGFATRVALDPAGDVARQPLRRPGSRVELPQPPDRGSMHPEVVAAAFMSPCLSRPPALLASR